MMDSASEALTKLSGFTNDEALRREINARQGDFEEAANNVVMHIQVQSDYENTQQLIKAWGSFHRALKSEVAALTAYASKLGRRRSLEARTNRARLDTVRIDRDGWRGEHPDDQQAI